MKWLISYIYLKINGWKIHGGNLREVRRCVLIVAPHTSNLDFIIGRAAFYYLHLKNVKFLIKKEMFKFPIGWIIKGLGAVPVDRSRGNTTVQESTELFNKYKGIYLLLTPEGTRKKVDKWKRGFYQIAMNANVPIVMLYIDYGKKEGGLGGILYPTGDFDKDFESVKALYKNVTAKHPENFNPDFK
jgi:1-acyl-sn-glycerol-3-phosphate acyltransferase